MRLRRWIHRRWGLYRMRWDWLKLVWVWLLFFLAIALISYVWLVISLHTSDYQHTLY